MPPPTKLLASDASLIISRMAVPVLYYMLKHRDNSVSDRT